MLQEPQGSLSIRAWKYRWPVLLLAVPLAPSAPVSAQQQDAGQTSSTVDITIKFAPAEERKPVVYELVNGRPVLKVVVNGHEAWDVLDNNASNSVIDAAFARSLGLELSSFGAKLATPTSTQQLWRVGSAVAIEIPGQISMTAPVTATDLSALSAMAGRPISLLLGREYFSGMVFLFTPGNHRLVLGPSGSLRLADGARGLALQGDRSAIEVLVGGRPAVLDINIGSNGEIALGQAAWDQTQMTALPILPSASASVTGKIDYSIKTEVDMVMLGSTPVTDVTVTLAPGVAEDRDGSVGFGLLSQFNFALDVKAQRLWLLPPFPDWMLAAEAAIKRTQAVAADQIAQ